MKARVEQIGIPLYGEILQTAWEVQYESIGTSWKTFNVYSDETIAHYVKDLLEKDKISVPLF